MTCPTTSAINAGEAVGNLGNLKKEAPEWKAYSEGYIETMGWILALTKEKLGPMLWHTDPLVFWDALKAIQPRHQGFLL